MLNRGEQCSPLCVLQREVQFFDKLGALCRESSHRVSLRQHRTIPALQLKHRCGGCEAQSALQKCSIIHKVLSALFA